MVRAAAGVRDDRGSGCLRMDLEVGKLGERAWWEGHSRNAIVLRTDGREGIAGTSCPMCNLDEAYGKFVAVDRDHGSASLAGADALIHVIVLHCTQAPCLQVVIIVSLLLIAVAVRSESGEISPSRPHT